jgi:hypothetical protein
MIVCSYELSKFLFKNLHDKQSSFLIITSPYYPKILTKLNENQKKKSKSL